tara:strand:- start:2494 stop:2790 length:297 start_codon:yes stop_codon:yes gene_type:complete
MIKLTEVVEEAQAYNAKLKKVNSTYRLKNFYINPKFIVSMSAHDALDDIHKRGPIIKDLVPEARFTKMTVASGVHGTTFYNILGSPAQHMDKLSTEKR